MFTMGNVSGKSDGYLGEGGYYRMDVIVIDKKGGVCFLGV